MDQVVLEVAVTVAPGCIVWVGVEDIEGVGEILGVWESVGGGVKDGDSE